MYISYFQTIGASKNITMTHPKNQELIEMEARPQEAVATQYSTSSAARAFNAPHQTLYGRLNGKPPGAT